MIHKDIQKSSEDTEPNFFLNSHFCISWPPEKKIKQGISK